MRLRILTGLLLAISLAGVSFATKHPCYNLSVAPLVLNPLQHFHTLICISADPNSGIGSYCEWADGEQSLLTCLFYGPVLSIYHCIGCYCGWANWSLTSYWRQNCLLASIIDNNTRT